MNILVTGSRGFIGRNLISHLRQVTDWQILEYEIDNTTDELVQALKEADFLCHLAGVNRPESVDEFKTGNTDLTARICDHLMALGKSTPFLISSSIQAELDNPYGISKRQAEAAAKAYVAKTGARGLIYRLTNVFGKWCRPNYNSVVATFCYNVARGLPVKISDRSHVIGLVHIDDVVRDFVAEIQRAAPGGVYEREVRPIYQISLGDLADLITSFRSVRETLHLPDYGDNLTRKLYGTYLSYLETDDFAYDLTQRCDPRGCLAEFLKSPTSGQIFVSSTKPGVTRGNHYHHTKTEKFLVLQGEAVIRFRHIESDEILSYPVRGEDFRVIDIPPGYTHSIENVGTGDLITLFWSSEVFDPDAPDTYWLQV